LAHSDPDGGLMLRVEFLPAAHGDCVLVSYGATGADHWMLVDGGPSHTYDALRTRVTEAGIRRFEVVVVSHIDADHIDGVIRLVQDEAVPVDIGDVWFNGRHHLDEAVDRKPRQGVTQLGGVEGEILGVLLADLALPWNAAFGGGPIMVDDNPKQPLPTVELAGGLKLTILSPYVRELDRLRRVWDKAVRVAGFEPGDRDKALAILHRRSRLQAPPAQLGGDDSSEANGSSIAFLVEYADAAVLLSADAFHSVISRSLDRLRTERAIREGVRLDAWKLAHHGSRNNTDAAMLRRARCRNFVVSTNGDRFRHPDREAIELVHSVPDAELWFNYRSATTEPFEKATAWAHRTHYPDPGSPLVFEF
jgi:beta-lactamase superfamily II metal-dependent hydrolase